MTSRERVRTTLAHETPDRIPNGLGATLNTGVHVLAYDRLRRLLGLQERRARIMSFEMNALLELDVVEALGIDLASVGLKINPARFWTPGYESDWKPVQLFGNEYLLPSDWSLSVEQNGDTYMDGLCWDPFTFNVPTTQPACRLLCPSGGVYFDPVPLAGAELPPNVRPDDYSPPDDYPDEWLRLLQDSAKFMFENTSLGLVCDEMINDFQLAPGGLDQWWMKLLTDPAEVHAYLDKACDAALSQIRLLDEAMGDYVDILQIAQDFGDLRGVQIGPHLWREVYKPHFKRLFEGWHAKTSMSVSLHSCGSIADILPDLVECGLEVFNPVQVSASSMDPAALKRAFGDDLVFYGGSYDAVSNPPETPEQIVYERVRTNIEALASGGGGYIFAGVHNIQGNVPDSHLRAIVRAYDACAHSVVSV